MNKDYFDALQLKEMFIAGANNLALHKEMINNLNVFPVPDGDTGTNMSLTVLAASKELEKNDHLTYETFAKAMSMGALMGARGNSGVILSQIFRGFASVIEKADRVDKETIAQATHEATRIAYKAVIKPVEGTILTIIRALGEAANESLTQDTDLEGMLAHMRAHGFEVLDKTPDMLPALKQANVVDAGGMGLLVMVEGMEAYLQGRTIEDVREETSDESKITDHKELSQEDIVYPYCTELFIKGLNLHKSIITHGLEKLEGDSMVVVVQDNVAKVHMHTDNPGKLLDFALSQGTIHDIKIDNMQEQYDQRQMDREKKAVGFLCVAAGEGLKEIATSIGIDTVVSGGQTMNPSTEDIVAGIQEVHADTVYVLPNNKNIIMAAQQSRHVLQDIDIRVIPSRSFAQGVSAMIAFNPEDSHDDNEKAMTQALADVDSLEVTYAVRDTEYEDHTIQEGAILGLAEGDIQTTGKEVEKTTLDLIDQVFDDHEIITLYYGEETSKDQAEKLVESLEKAYPDTDIELYAGGQALYYYLISME